MRTKPRSCFFAGEIDSVEFAAVVLAGFPADLAAQAGLVAGGLDVTKLAEEFEENGPNEIPIFGSAGGGHWSDGVLE